MVLLADPDDPEGSRLLGRKDNPEGIGYNSRAASAPGKGSPLYPKPRQGRQKLSIFTEQVAFLLRLKIAAVHPSIDGLAIDDPAQFIYDSNTKSLF
jgi:hypothetical protein